MISAGYLCGRQSVAAARQWRADCSICSRWLCLVPPLPLLALDAAHRRPQATWHSLWQMSPTGLISMLFHRGDLDLRGLLAVGRLLRDYTAQPRLVPFALLVPFIGAAASSVIFGEAVRVVAARRHGHGRLRHRHHGCCRSGRKPCRSQSCRDCLREHVRSRCFVAFVVFRARS